MYKIINENLQENHDCKTNKKYICEKNILSCGEKYGYRKQKDRKTESAKVKRGQVCSNTEISQSCTPPVLCPLPKFAGPDMGIH